MKRQLKVTITGVLTGITFVAVAVSIACNKSTTVDCKPTGSNCSAASPNCSSATYSGTVSDPGTKTAITGGSPGYTVWEDGEPCSYVCTITKDCANLSPQVNRTGEKNKKPPVNPTGC